MDQVFVINPKGGCGKTTIATQLAAYYANLGYRVLLADHDAQKSSSDWLRSRPASCASIDGIALRPEQACDVGDARVIVHDMPAAWTLKHVGQVLLPGDRLLIPVLASPTDIKACLRFIMALDREGVMDLGVNIGLVGNRMKSNTRYFAVLSEFLTRLDLPFIGWLRDTQNYLRLMERGFSIFDLPPSRVRRDLEEWSPILTWLDAHRAQSQLSGDDVEPLRSAGLSSVK